MLTLSAEQEIERDGRAAYRPYRATVASVSVLSPNFRRVTFTGPDFQHFATHGLDQRIKLLFPLPNASSHDLGVSDEISQLDGSWYTKWRALPDDRRSPFRTYTVRGIRPSLREVDVDFVWHADGGPAARWLASAAAGDEIVIIGPDARSRASAVGIDWHPGDARELLLVGDGTSTPAICSILESLGAGVRARAFILIPSPDDALEVNSTADVEVTWVTDDLEGRVRSWALEHASRFTTARATTGQMVPELAIDGDILWNPPVGPAGDFYAWMAGESTLIKGLRRILVNEWGIDRSRVEFMGYWRRGTAESAS